MRRIKILMAVLALVIVVLAALFVSNLSCYHASTSERDLEPTIHTTSTTAVPVENPLSASDVFLPADTVDISVGSVMPVEITVIPATAIETPVLSSSDSSIIKVIDGKLLPINIGTAKITVCAGAASDSMTVTVTDSRKEYVIELLDALAYSADASVPEKISEFTEAMSFCTLPDSDKYAQLLNDVLAKKVSGDAKALGISTDLIRQACVSVWGMKQHEKHDVTMSFVGDCTLARFNENAAAPYFPAVYKNSGSVTYPFDNVRGLFNSDDLTLINFECALTESTEHAEKQFYFRGDVSYTDMLAKSSIEAVNLANNHSSDYFKKGLDDTVAAMNSAGIKNCFENSPDFYEVKAKNGDIIKIVLLSTSSTGKYRKAPFDALREQIKKYRADNTIIVVSVHWGIERDKVPAGWQKWIAHEMIDDGADIIIGHHSHTLQGVESYHGKYVAYSLGNFSFGGNNKATRPETIVLRAGFDIVDGKASCTGLYVAPCLITSSGNSDNDYKPCLVYGSKGKEVMALMKKRCNNIPGIKKLEWYEI